MPKVSFDTLTAGMLNRNFKETVRQFISNDNAYNFMNSIKGTPAYWKRFLHEVMAMVKQTTWSPNFFPHFFMCRLKVWNDMLYVIPKVNGTDISEDEISGMSYSDRCKLLNGNPVIVAKHFEYRVELIF